MLKIWYPGYQGIFKEGIVGKEVNWEKLNEIPLKDEHMYVIDPLLFGG